MTTNTLGTSSRYAIFDWLWDNPHRDAVIALAATDTMEDGGAGNGETNNAATDAPAIDGTAQVGQTLTASTSGIADSDGLNNVSYDYQWIAKQRNGGHGPSGRHGPDLHAVGERRGQDHQGKGLVHRRWGERRDVDQPRQRRRVLATVPTEPLSLTVARGDENQELDASWQAPSSNGGSAVTGYKVQWKEASDNWDAEADVSEDSETGSPSPSPG